MQRSFPARCSLPFPATASLFLTTAHNPALHPSFPALYHLVPATASPFPALHLTFLALHLHFPALHNVPLPAPPANDMQNPAKEMQNPASCLGDAAKIKRVDAEIFERDAESGCAVAGDGMGGAIWADDLVVVVFHGGDYGGGVGRRDRDGGERELQ